MDSVRDELVCNDHHMTWEIETDLDGDVIDGVALHVGVAHGLQLDGGRQGGGHGKAGARVKSPHTGGVDGVADDVDVGDKGSADG